MNEVPTTLGSNIIGCTESNNSSRNKVTGTECIQDIIAFVSLLECGNINDQSDIYRVYKHNMHTQDNVRTVVSTVVDYYRKKYKEKIGCFPRSVFACPLCSGVLLEPVTVPCGHTFCKQCVREQSYRVCNVCTSKVCNYDMRSLKPNVLVTNLVESWWEKEIESSKLRTEGDRKLQQEQIEEALRFFDKAVLLAPQDHVLLTTRSGILHALGRPEDALKDADASIRLNPYYSLGHYRKAKALSSLGRHQDAIVAYILYVVVEKCGEEDLAGVCDDITKLLHLILTRLNRRQNCAGNYCCTQNRRASHSSGCAAYPQHSDGETSSMDDDDYEAESGLKRGRRKETSVLPSKMELAPVIPSASNRGCPFHKLKSSGDVNAENIYVIRSVLRKVNHAIDTIQRSTACMRWKVDGSHVNKSDLECSLCFQLFWEPVSTPCGHSFCKSCLDRCLDHSPFCPLCKSSLKEYLAERRSSITEFVEVALQTLLPEEYQERRQSYELEMDHFAKAGKDLFHEVPIFVATLAFPTIKCPLHVFEPRYRLMIRRCLESGTREFGMCLPSLCEGGYANSGTMLKILDIEFTSDGRSILSTVGSRRFKCVSRGTKDGYNTAAVSFMQDEVVHDEFLPELQKLHSAVHEQVFQWFGSIEACMRQRIHVHYGPMPLIERDFWTLPDGPSWVWWAIAVLPLHARIQLKIISETSLRVRLIHLGQILTWLQNRAKP